MADVVVTRRIDPQALSRLDPLGPWIWVGHGPVPRRTLLAEVVEARGLLTMLTERIDAELLDAAPRLEVVSQMAVGVDNIDIGACAERGVAVGYTPDVLTETTADTAWALLAAAVRRIPEGRDHITEGRWGEWDPELLLGGDLYGTTLGIVGLGRIGSAIARRANGFDMRVLYTARHRKPHLEAQLGVAYRELDALLSQADHVVLSVALTAETRHLIGAPELSRMKPAATLVNVGRGELVDSAALVEALAGGRPAAAALDVTDPEPIPADHPLVGLPNCLIVPHLGSASVRTRRAMANLAVDNLVAGLGGHALPAQMRATADSVNPR